MKSTNTRLNKLEDRNVEADRQAKDDRVITIKEVFERVIALEVKYDMKIVDDRKNTKKFEKYVYFLSFLTILDIALTLVAIYLHSYMGG
jgi:hypothetical protein